MEMTEKSLKHKLKLSGDFYFCQAHTIKTVKTLTINQALATMTFWLVYCLAELNLIVRDNYISLIEITHFDVTLLNGTDMHVSVHFA